MRYSVVATGFLLSACLSDTPSEPGVPLVPQNPLISILASEPGTWVMSRLGADESSPFRINQTLCNGLPTHTDVVDTIFFNGDGSYRRVYRSYSRLWRTVGVPEPVEIQGRNSFEQVGTVGGRGDVLTLIVREVRQNEEAFQSFPANRPNEMAFAIRGTMFTRGETLGTGCLGERIPATAEFTRAAE